jgi:VanZ family protein
VGIFLYLATKRWWLVIAIVSLYGISDEFHQSFVSGRSVDSTDWIADTVGAVLAVTGVKFLTRDKNS